jgi:spore photoproduct lyase
MVIPPLDIARIYLDPAVKQFALEQEILARFPEAERIPVASHWRIPELREGDVGVTKLMHRL